MSSGCTHPPTGTTAGPTLLQLNDWRWKAHEMTAPLADSDPVWYSQFWSDVVASGYGVSA
jgi:hypothetical protein